MVGGTVERWRCDSPGLSDFLWLRFFALLTFEAEEVWCGKARTVLQVSLGYRLDCVENWDVYLSPRLPLGANSLQRGEW